MKIKIPATEKPANWFPLQINILVSIRVDWQPLIDKTYTIQKKSISRYHARYVKICHFFLLVMSFIDGTKFTLHKKIKCSVKDFFSICWTKPKFSADLFTFTEELLHGKLDIFACSVSSYIHAFSLHMETR